MPRSIATEWLDVLPADDARACQSRRDLRRLNRIMGHVRILTGELRSLATKPRRSLLEVGAGDGWVLSQVARQLGPGWGGTELLLLDNKPQANMSLREFADLGWIAQLTTVDVLNYGAEPQTAFFCATIANLFLHHFSTNQLRRLLSSLAARTNSFIALEPRRSGLALLASRCVGLIGCNSVTRHDAPASVRAGFCDHEISSLWPQEHSWRIREQRVGLFSHLFVAQRSEVQ